MSDGETQTYGAMLKEVETIIGKIAEPTMDLDAMVNQVQRGYELISGMRLRLEQVKGQLEELRLKFEGSKESGDTPI